MGDYPEFSGTNGELYLRARSACHPSARRNAGIVTITKAQNEGLERFAQALQVAAWCEGKAVLGVIGEKSFLVRPGARVVDLLRNFRNAN